MALSQLPELTLSNSAMSVLEAAERGGRLTLAGSVEELVELAVPKAQCDSQGYFTVGYDVPGRGYTPEARVCRVRNRYRGQLHRTLYAAARSRLHGHRG